MTNASGNETWTVGRLLQWTTRWFTEHKIEGGRLAAELLLAHAMECKKIELYTRYDQEPSEQQKAQFRSLVKQAGEHTPIAYLLGHREFFSLDFKVTPAVLIPRPETEALVQRVIEICRQQPEKIWRILDVGTGSGCIAISIAKLAANTALVAGDISPQALEVAAANIRRHHLESRVQYGVADGAHVPAELIPDGGFDLVVSNPPYIGEAEYGQLPPNVRDHEPKAALIPPDGDALSFYRRLALETPAVLASEGRLLVEIGHDQHDSVRWLVEESGQWEHLGSHRNPTDPFDRVMEFRCQNGAARQ